MEATIKKEVFFSRDERDKFVESIGKHNVISYSAKTIDGVRIWTVTYYAD